VCYGGHCDRRTYPKTRRVARIGPLHGRARKFQWQILYCTTPSPFNPTYLRPATSACGRFNEAARNEATIIRIAEVLGTDRTLQSETQLQLGRPNSTPHYTYSVYQSEELEKREIKNLLNIASCSIMEK